MRITQQLEETYKRRIENMLALRVGPGRVSAEVVADLDFTITEETRESFDPQQTVIRSEQISEEEVRDASGLAQGVPGAASNQPTEAGDANAQSVSGSAGEAVNLARSSTRNFEVDRTISRILPPSGRIQRLSVAILIDDSPDASDGADAEGLSDEDIVALTNLARSAIGFDEARGDTLEVTRAPFRELPALEPPEEPAIWQNPMVIDIAKLLLGAGVALALGFGLIRPMLKGLLASSGGSAGFAAGGPGLLMASGGGQAGGGQFAIAAPSFDEKVAAAKNITNHDPARVAQIVRKWVSDNG
jgi:flagellar M-ring protein FliF